MSASKMMLTFVSGVAAGWAVSYFADPKGSEKRYKQLRKDFDKRAKKIEGTLSSKMDGYKKTYNDLLEKYIQNGKEVLKKSKSSVQLK